MLKRLAPLLLLFGAILFGLGILTYAREADAQRDPAVVTAADLVAKGPPKNLHLRVIEATPVFNNGVKLTTTRRGSTSEESFLPLTTMPVGFGDKPVLAAVVEMKPEEFAAYRGGPVQGIRKISFDSLNSKVADRLSATYGKEAVNKAIVIQFNRGPGGLGMAYGFIVAGVLCLAAGIFGIISKPAAMPAAPYSAPGSIPPPPPPAR